jgi:membrane-associated phospholipid phosphatase
MSRPSHRRPHRRRFALAAIALCSQLAVARAQPGPAAPPTGDPATGAPATDGKDKATPDPDKQTPDKNKETAEDAQAAAKAAELTPIVPLPSHVRRPAFQLYAEIDLPVFTIGLVFVSVRFVRTQTAFCAPQCNPGDLNALDRTTAGFWSPGWRTASNVGLIALGGGVAALLIGDEGWLKGVNDLVVIAESAMSATAATSIMTIAAGRPRPFLYGLNAPLSERNSTDAANSFLSSHAAVGFAIATSTYVAMHRLHPRSRLPYLVLGLGLGAASFVATSRVLAGQHFITDALGGGLAGSSMGVLISSVHGSPVSIVPVVGERHHGLGIQGSF